MHATRSTRTNVLRPRAPDDEKVKQLAHEDEKPRKKASAKDNLKQDPECDQKPVNWNEYKINSAVGVPISAPKFEVYSDEHDDADAADAWRPPPSAPKPPQPKRRGPNSPPVARFEQEDPAKKYFSDTRKMYVGGEEFSFEEMRGRKWLAWKKREEERRKNQQMEEEIKLLRQQVAFLMKNAANGVIPPQVLGKIPTLDSVPSSASSDCSRDNRDSDSQKGSVENVRSDSSESKTNISKATMSKLRYETLDCFEETDAFKKAPENNANFSVFVDPTTQIVGTNGQEPQNTHRERTLDIENMTLRNDGDTQSQYHFGADFSIQNRSLHLTQAITFPLPRNEADFMAAITSTPAPPSKRNKKRENTNEKVSEEYEDAQETNSRQQSAGSLPPSSDFCGMGMGGGLTAKLSPIVETSREYHNSKSSSSSSGTMSTNSCLTGHHKLARISFPLRNQGSIDPFDEALIVQLLNCLDEPLFCRKGFFQASGNMPRIRANQTSLKLGNDKYLILDQTNTGAYAKIYKAQIEDFDSYEDTTATMASSRAVSMFNQKTYALKICKPPNAWEFYICNELQKRLSRNKNDPDIELSVMNPNPGVVFNDGSILVDEFCDNGNLLDIVNLYKKKSKTVPRSLIAYFALELLQILTKMHDCKIVHADIKPDNVLVLGIPSREDLKNIHRRTSCLKLIDFGRSIDMALLPEGTTFTKAFEKKATQCPEMLEGRAWSYQIDYYGVLDCIHTLMFGEYIGGKIRKNNNGEWELCQKVKRYHETGVWDNLFRTLLNSSSCTRTLLDPIKSVLSSWLDRNSRELMSDAADLENML